MQEQQACECLKKWGKEYFGINCEVQVINSTTADVKVGSDKYVVTFHDDLVLEGELVIDTLIPVY